LIIGIFALACAIFSIIYLKEPPKHKSSIAKNSDICQKLKSSKILTKFTPINSCILYAMLGFVDIIFNEILPIWFWTPTIYRGLGLEPYKIGLLGKNIITSSGILWNNNIFWTVDYNTIIYK
jgi:hypothetical protein